MEKIKINSERNIQRKNEGAKRKGKTKKIMVGLDWWDPQKEREVRNWRNKKQWTNHCYGYYGNETSLQIQKIWNGLVNGVGVNYI